MALRFLIPGSSYRLSQPDHTWLPLPTQPLSGKIQAPSVMHSKLPITCSLPLSSASTVAVWTHISPSCLAAISPKVPCWGLPLFPPWGYLLLTHRLPFESWAWPIRSFLWEAWDCDRERQSQFSWALWTLKVLSASKPSLTVWGDPLGPECGPW